MDDNSSDRRIYCINMIFSAEKFEFITGRNKLVINRSALDISVLHSDNKFHSLRSCGDLLNNVNEFSQLISWTSY